MSKQTAADTTLIYTKIVERYAPFFDRPEARLRFLHNTLAQQAVRETQLRRTLYRFTLIQRTGIYQWLLQLGFYRLIFEELNRLMPSISPERRGLLQQTKAPLTARLFFRVYQARRVFYGAGLATAAIALFGLYSLVVWSTHRVNAYLAQRYQTPGRPAASSASGSNTALAETVTKYLPNYKPEKVWLVERKDDYEQYSNSGRILTRYETENHPRGYRVIKRGAEKAEEAIHHEPVGIIYHSSESDIVPFTADNNRSIQARTRGLLEYVHKNKSYNYVVDRFGQIYRIVRDDQAANHAGNSVWADQQNIYVGLNESFIGVCFESTSDAGPLDEQLTEAQIVGGRALTAILRSKYNLDDANCTTHGLVSVNPDSMVIGFHHDWVRNFPFEWMGLSDKYKVAPASVSEFGFTYDESILAKLGGTMWAGVALAEEEFKRRAERANTKPELLRGQLRNLYREEIEVIRKLRLSPPAEAEKARPAPETSLARSQPNQGDTSR